MFTYQKKTSRWLAIN